MTSKTLLILGNRLIVYGLLFGLVLSLIGFAFYYPIGRVFTKETIVLNEFYKVFWIIIAMQPICSVSFIFDGIFKGLGETKYLRNVLFFSSTLVFIPTLLILDFFNYKLYAVWTAFFLWIIARGLPLIIRFRKKFNAILGVI